MEKNDRSDIWSLRHEQRLFFAMNGTGGRKLRGSIDRQKSFFVVAQPPQTSLLTRYARIRDEI